MCADTLNVGHDIPPTQVVPDSASKRAWPAEKPAFFMPVNPHRYLKIALQELFHIPTAGKNTVNSDEFLFIIYSIKHKIPRHDHFSKRRQFFVGGVHIRHRFQAFQSIF